MSGLKMDQPKGLLRRGWTATVDDYAIAGDWACRGNIFSAGDASGSVFGFDGKSGATRWKHPGIHEGGLLTMAVHPTGSKLATSGQDGCIRIWSAADGKPLQTIELGDGWVETLAWSSDGQWLAASLSRRVHVYTTDGELAWQSDNHPSTVSALAWSGAEELATACYGRVAFYGASTGIVQQELQWKGSLVSMVLSPDGDIVACGSQDNSVHFWRRSTGEDSQMHGYPCKPSSLSFDPSGTLLATGGAETVTVWSFQGDGPEGTKPGLLELHVQPISSVAFAHHRSQKLASGARDGSVVLWSIQDDGNGKPVGAALLGGSVAGLAWRPDDRGLAALDGSGRITVWRI